MSVDLACPACKAGVIHLKTELLMEGRRFACTGCDAVLSLSEGEQSALEKGLKRFEHMAEQTEGLKSRASKPMIC